MLTKGRVPATTHDRQVNAAMAAEAHEYPAASAVQFHVFRAIVILDERAIEVQENPDARCRPNPPGKMHPTIASTIQKMWNAGLSLSHDKRNRAPAAPFREGFERTRVSFSRGFDSGRSVTGFPPFLASQDGSRPALKSVRQPSDKHCARERPGASVSCVSAFPLPAFPRPCGSFPRFD
jgi:hypothetical protein